jgi:hypothetical protein
VDIIRVHYNAAREPHVTPARLWCVSRKLCVNSAVKANSHIPCRSHAFTLSGRSTKGLDCVFTIWFTQWLYLIHTCNVVPLPCHDHAVLKRRLKATAQRGMRTTWYVWITCSIGRPETACRRPARVRLFPVTTRSYTKVVTRNRLAVRIFLSTTRYFTKDTALSENGRLEAWCVWIDAAWERHGMCELALILRLLTCTRGRT